MSGCGPSAAWAAVAVAPNPVRETAIAAETARPFLHRGERVRVRMGGRPCSSVDARRIRARDDDVGSAGTRVFAVFG
jgi:hypothetical protein